MLETNRDLRPPEGFTTAFQKQLGNFVARARSNTDSQWTANTVEDFQRIAREKHYSAGEQPQAAEVDRAGDDAERKQKALILTKPQHLCRYFWNYTVSPCRLHTCTSAQCHDQAH